MLDKEIWFQVDVILKNYNFETVEFALARTETIVNDTLLQTEPWKYLI